MKRLAHSKLFAASAAATAILLTAACGSGGEPADGTSQSSTDDGGDSARTYQDGDYEGHGSYPNPGGQSSVTVNLTLEGGKIADIDVTPEASGESRQFQEKFVSGIADEVVGKRIDEIKVSKVAGSSLTSMGFNEAIKQIKEEARA